MANAMQWPIIHSFNAFFLIWNKIHAVTTTTTRDLEHLSCVSRLAPRSGILSWCYHIHLCFKICQYTSLAYRILSYLYDNEVARITRYDQSLHRQSINCNHNLLPIHEYCFITIRLRSLSCKGDLALWRSINVITEIDDNCQKMSVIWQ